MQQTYPERRSLTNHRKVRSLVPLRDN